MYIIYKKWKNNSEVRYINMNNLMRTKESIDNLFSDFFHGSKKNYMKTDIKETKEEYMFYIDVPGLKKENIKINYEDGYLEIEGKQEFNSFEETKDFIHKERQSETVSRSYYVGKEINEEEIKAELKDGVLKLNVPKKEEQKMKKYIEIE